MRYKRQVGIAAVIALIFASLYVGGVRIEWGESNEAFADDSILIDENSTITALNGHEPIDPEYGNWKKEYQPRAYSLPIGDQLCVIVLHPENAAISCLPPSQ